MKWKNRLTNYNFWISIISAVLLLLQAFDFEFDILYVNEILTAVLGLLVVIGIISDPTRIMVDSNTKTKENKSTENKSTADVDIANEPKLSIEENIESSIEESIDMPIQEEVSSDEGANQFDLQAVIDKIREDLINIRTELTSKISSPLTEVKCDDEKTLPMEEAKIDADIQEENEESHASHNIVNV